MPGGRGVSHGGGFLPVARRYCDPIAQQVRLADAEAPPIARPATLRLREVKLSFIREVYDPDRERALY